MRRLAGGFLLLALLTTAACDPASVEPTSTTSDILAPPDGFGVTATSTTVTTSAPPVTNDPSPYTYEGNLPDGTHFRARVPGPRPEQMLVVAGDFSYRFDADTNVPVGEVRYLRASGTVESGYVDGVLRLRNQDWVLEVFFSPEVLEQFRGSRAVILRGIGLDIQRGLPVVVLGEPFTWAGSSPQIRYETFVVAAGCLPGSVRCTENHAAQILNIEGQGLSDDRADGLTLETTSLRPRHNPNYLDPGPLSERMAASLLWTGTEMIVWGGKAERDGVPYLSDGAAFDPAANEWRMLPPIPGIEGALPSRALWADGEMIVISPDGTFGYDPGADRWRTIGDGILPPEFHDRMLYAEGKVYVWASTTSIQALDVSAGEWSEIDPPLETTYSMAWTGAIRYVNGRLIAVVLDDSPCQEKLYWQLVGADWQPMPGYSLATAEYSDCSTANQSASVSNDLVIWDSFWHPAGLYSPFHNAWRELEPVPLDGVEGGSGPVPMDDDHFMVPRWGGGAVFDANSDDPLQDETWTLIDLPGSGSDAEIIWTGDEFLAWGIWGTFDAWRWSPPEDVFIGGGDDAK